MSPGGQRPAGPDAPDAFLCTCSCGYRRTLYAHLDNCPEVENHEQGKTYDFSCVAVES